MSLYQISRDDVETGISNPDCPAIIENSRHTVLRTEKGKFKDMPLKIVYVVEEGDVVVLSAYPVKKAYKRQSNESKL